MLDRSIAYALAHREESIRYASAFARGIDAGTVDEFVSMYVNRWTVECGPIGEAAVKRLFREAIEADLLPEGPDVQFLRAGMKSAQNAYA